MAHNPQRSTRAMAWVAIICCHAPALGANKLESEFEKARRAHEQQRKAIEKEIQQANTRLQRAQSVGLPAPTPVPTFNPVGTPAPEACLQAFVQGARAAKTFEEILPYLPQSEREQYEYQKAHYDPKAAAARKARMQAEGHLDQAAIDHLTDPPGVFLLRHYQTIAQKMRSISKSNPVQGDRVTLEVVITSNAVINGQNYSRSTATVGLKGEGKYWYFDTFKESMVVEHTITIPGGSDQE